jgi:hypothetical protein
MSLPDLDENTGDKVAGLSIATAKAIVSAGTAISLPGIGLLLGPLLAEVIGAVIPQRRYERIVDTLKIFNKKIEQLDEAVREAKIRDEAFQDILEEGVWQAARASTDERKGYIAAVLANSLTDEELSRVQQKRLLDILGELNDAEIIILLSYSFRSQDERIAFHQQHQQVLIVGSVALGGSEQDADQAAVHRTYKAHLIRLGLLRQQYKKPSKGKEIDFDFDNGTIAPSGTSITRLGRMFLKYLDAPVDASSEKNQAAEPAVPEPAQRATAPT